MGDSGFLILRRNVNVEDDARLLGTLDAMAAYAPGRGAARGSSDGAEYHVAFRSPNPSPKPNPSPNLTRTPNPNPDPNPNPNPSPNPSPSPSPNPSPSPSPSPTQVAFRSPQQLRAFNAPYQVNPTP